MLIRQYQAQQPPDPQEPQPIELPAGKPWNPSTIASLFFLITFLGAEILLAFNWPRLGKKNWTLPTILIAVALPFATFGPLFAASTQGRAPDNLILPALILLAGALGLNLGFFAALSHLQNGAYKKWHKENDVAAMLAHEYDFVTAGIIIVVFIVVFIALAVIFVYPQTQSHWLETTTFKVEYPSGWEPLDPAQQPICQQARRGCAAYLSNKPYDYTSIVFVEVPLEGGTNLQAFEQDQWNRISSGGDIQLIEWKETEVGGYESISREYERPSSSGDMLRIQQFFVVANKVGLVITAIGLNRGIFNEDRADIERIINTLKFSTAPQI